MGLLISVFAALDSHRHCKISVYVCTRMTLSVQTYYIAKLFCCAHLQEMSVVMRLSRIESITGAEFFSRRYNLAAGQRDGQKKRERCLLCQN